jgi:mono/diheme cytochrome c family protein
MILREDTMKKVNVSILSIFLTLICVVIIASIIWGVMVYGGSYNIAASKPHNQFVEWSLDKTMISSVKKHSASINAPKLTARMAERAQEDYSKMCQVCHAAPGVKRSEISKGLLPQPPLLFEEMDEWSSEDIFWIVKHGIKFTGMPAFGITHPDDKIWDMTAYVYRLPEKAAAESDAEHSETGEHESHTH